MSEPTDHQASSCRQAHGFGRPRAERRRGTVVAALAALSLVAAACGNDADGGLAEPDEDDATTTETTEPQDEGDGDEPTAEDETAAAAIDADALLDLLITTGEVGDGFSESFRGEIDAIGDGDQFVGMPPECEAGFDQLDNVTASDVWVQAVHDREDTTEVTHWMGAVAEPEVAEIAATWPAQCGEPFPVQVAGTDAQVSMTTEPVEGLGDEAIASTLTIEIPEGTLDRYLVVVARSGVVSSIRATNGIEARPTGDLVTVPADRDLVRTLSERVDADLQTRFG